jgi:hypothetical protein
MSGEFFLSRQLPTDLGLGSRRWAAGKTKEYAQSTTRTKLYK